MSAPPNPFRRDSSWSKPGMSAHRSGLYRVYHYKHRLPHEVFIPAGTVFPKCKKCGEMVQFAPLLAGEDLSQDDDLASADSSAA
jgi:hypothetical protein